MKYPSEMITHIPMLTSKKSWDGSLGSSDCVRKRRILTIVSIAEIPKPTYFSFLRSIILDKTYEFKWFIGVLKEQRDNLFICKKKYIKWRNYD